MVKKESSDEIEVGKFVMNVLKNKYFQWSVTIILFLLILYSSTALRLGNLNVLKSQVDEGVYLSNDLDSMLFYRQAETRMELGYWPEYDEMRSPGYNTPWIRELINDVLIWNYKVLNFFDSSINFNYASTVSAPIFFAIGLILFFILSLLLTKSKIGSLAAVTFLAYAPGFLFRSIAGFYDHDHLGVFTLFAVMIIGVLSFRYFERNYKNLVIWGIILGFFTSLMLYSWGGGITFLLVFLPLAFLLHYLFNVENKERFVLFYLIWFVTSIVFTPILGMKAGQMYDRFLDSQGILVLFVLGFSIIDMLIYRFKDRLKFLNEKYLHGYSFGVTAILGSIGLFVIGKNPVRLFNKAWATLIYPFFGEFGDRLGSTVAENAQPYLVDLINQNGKILFWLFLIGMVVISINFVKNSRSLKNKFILASSIIALLFAILISRISPDHTLNGENFISQTIYLLGGLIFLGAIGYVYMREKFKIDIELIFLFSVALTTVVNARAAIRSFFLITPFIALIAGYFIAELVKKLEIENE